MSSSDIEQAYSKGCSGFTKTPGFVLKAVLDEVCPVTGCIEVCRAVATDWKSVWSFTCGPTGFSCLGRSMSWNSVPSLSQAWKFWKKFEENQSWWHESMINNTNLKSLLPKQLLWLLLSAVLQIRLDFSLLCFDNRNWLLENRRCLSDWWNQRCIWANVSEMDRRLEMSSLSRSV